MNKPQQPEQVKMFATLGKTKVIKGTILTPEMAGLRMIVTAAPESGKPEDELYTLLDKKWKNAKAEFKGWYQHHINFKLGNIHETAVQSDTWIMHCLFVNKKGEVDAKALESCLKKLCEKAKFEKASVHVAKVLTQQVPDLEKLMKEYLLDKGVSVYYYEEATKK